MSLDISALYLAHGSQIRAYFTRRLVDPDLADDLAQDVWVRAVQRADAYRATGAPVESWLYSIARNLLTDHIRRVNLPQHPRRLGAHDAGVPHPTDEIATATDRLVLLDALDVLTPRQRDVIALWDLRGYGGDNGVSCGAVLGLGRHTVKLERRHGLARMRAALEAA